MSLIVTVNIEVSLRARVLRELRGGCVLSSREISRFMGAFGRAFYGDDFLPARCSCSFGALSRCWESQSLKIWSGRMYIFSVIFL